MAKKATFKDIINAMECLSGKDVYCSTCFYNGMPKCREKVAQNASEMMLNMADMLDTADDCLEECRYSLTKWHNSRVESAVNDWKYTYQNNALEIIKSRNQYLEERNNINA